VKLTASARPERDSRLVCEREGRRVRGCQDAIATIWCQVAFENALNPFVCRFVYLGNKAREASISCIPPTNA